MTMDTSNPQKVATILRYYHVTPYKALRCRASITFTIREVRDRMATDTSNPQKVAETILTKSRRDDTDELLPCHVPYKALRCRASITFTFREVRDRMTMDTSNPQKVAKTILTKSRRDDTDELLPCHVPYKALRCRASITFTFREVRGRMATDTSNPQKVAKTILTSYYHKQPHPPQNNHVTATARDVVHRSPSPSEKLGTG
ncbi:hypothetical protein J6590_038703 [Homalodisca vitripennis]|nr:hypothetical protein J6590_038703 [Homalodisca vitripennis]